MPYANNHGVRIHYKVEGEGPPLVLQHGFTSNMQRWYMHGYVDALKDQYQLILLDARGHGASDKPHNPAAYAWDVRVSDVVTILDHLGIETTHFWGYSMGGVYAFSVAKYAPDRVNTLIIGGAHPYATSFEAFRGVDGTDQDVFLAALESVVGEPFTSDVKQRMLANDLQALAAAAQNRASMADILPTMTMPCLLYVGDGDIRHEPTRECAKQMSHATFITIPDCNHVEAMNRCDLVTPHVTKFLREHR